VLEESLLEFPGALVLVTHDRYLLDRATREVLALDGRGGAEFFADYEQWIRARRVEETPKKPRPKKRTSRKPQPKKLSYREQQEWDAMEENLLAAEARLEEAQAAVADPSVAADAAVLEVRCEQLAAAQREVDAVGGARGKAHVESRRSSG
jgi:ATP-binding cassette subfamily F protein uup